MPVSSRRLALELASCLEEVIPPQFSVVPDDDGLSVYADGVLIGGSSVASIVESQDDRTEVERLETAIGATLSAIQDLVVEHIAVWWPSGTQSNMPMPGVQIRGREAFMWFGDSEEGADVRIRSINVETITLPE